MKEQEQFQTACGICKKEFDKPQYPEQAPTQSGVTQIIICESCFQRAQENEQIESFTS